MLYVNIMKQVYDYLHRPFSIDLVPSGKSYRATIGAKTVDVILLCIDGNRMDLLIDGVPNSAYVSLDGAKRWVTVNGQTLELTKASATRKNAGHSLHSAGQLASQMPGLVRAINIVEGEHVKKGQTLAIIEAMKMENKLTAPFDGFIKKLMIKVGQTVEKEQALVEMIPTSDPDVSPTNIPE